jgi:hypothetical protein
METCSFHVLMNLLFYCRRSAIGRIRFSSDYCFNATQVGVGSEWGEVQNGRGLNVLNPTAPFRLHSKKEAIEGLFQLIYVAGNFMVYA